jgi:hypothetical protein
MPSQEDSIREELIKTGFPTEVVSSTIMQGRGWFVMHNPSYLDDAEDRSREFDIRAYKAKKETYHSKEYSVGIYLVTECKKSDKPWVFFTTPEKHLNSRLGGVIRWRLEKKQAFSDRSNEISLISDSHLRAFHHYFREARLARTFHQVFRKENERSQMIYSAVMSVVKATLFLTRKSFARSETWLRIYYPLVIFSGDLFEAQVQPNKEIKLLQSKHLQLSFNYFTPEVQQTTYGQSENEFIIDIVHEDYLDEFLKAIEAEHETISLYFFDAMDKSGRPS